MPVGPDRRWKAVVYPAGTVSGYGHVYSLGTAGIAVVALHPRWCGTFTSRHVTERHVVPDAATSPERFLEWLRTFGRRQSELSVLFLAEDLYAYLASYYQQELKAYFLYPFVPQANLTTFFDKSEMYSNAGDAGLRVPKTLFPPLNAARITDWSHYPAVVKPLVSRFTIREDGARDAGRFPEVFGGKALVADDCDQLARVAAEVERLAIPCCVQEFVPGPEHNLYNVKFVAAADSTVPACFVSQKLRQYPADFGTCTVARACFREELRHVAEAFCRSTRYVGPGCIECKWHRDERTFHFIEMNPRLDYWIRMATLKGVNLPLQQYLLSSGQTLAPMRQLDDDRCWVDVTGDVKGLAWRRGRPDHAIRFLDALGPYRRFDEAVFNSRDPFPGALRLMKAPLSISRAVIARPVGRIWSRREARGGRAE